MNNYAVFAHGEYDILNQLTLKAGVRGTEADRSDDSCGIYYRGTPEDPNGIIQNFVAFTAAFLGHRPFSPVGPNQCALIGPANGTPPDTAGKPPLWRSRSETDEASWETAVGPPLYTTHWGLLKQPDNQKPS